jgi:hypothetical protein
MDNQLEKILYIENSNFTIYIIVTIIVILLIFLIKRQHRNLGYIRSNIDGNYYLCRSRNDALRAANTFAEVNRRLLYLIKYLKFKYNNKKLNKLLEKYNSSAISEAGAENKSTSYLVNKGQSLILCIRDKTNEYNLLDINTIMFVALHEFAHLITVSIGHTDEFWSNFKFILINSSKIGIYKGVNYEIDSKPYCGIEITNSPLYSNDIISTKW